MILADRFATAVTVQIDELRKHLKRMKALEALSYLSRGDETLDFRPCA